ncbi:hypothetical protein L7F22_064633 [Adiantum nelumboides]|nr:hypothetical protein [Adiantum nelumboides]
MAMAKSSTSAASGSLLMHLLLLVVCVLITCAPRNSMADSGTATYYTTYIPSSCYGFNTSEFPAGPLIAAANTDVFRNKEACGHMYQIGCTGDGCTSAEPITVKVVDLCPGCNANQFDLSQEVFC